jgi:hypothetical protein
MPYVVTPKRVADGLEFIAREAEKAIASSITLALRYICS